MNSNLAKPLPEQIVCPSEQVPTWALVPVKNLDSAKQRLGACLGADRAGFTLAMLEDVLIALNDSRKVRRVAIVTADTQVAEMGKAYGAVLINEVFPDGMNQAIHLGMETLRKLGARRVLVIPADVPLATGAEIDRLMLELELQRALTGNPAIGIGPSADQNGTNFLCLPTGCHFEFHYGHDSYRQHQGEGMANALTPVALMSSTLARDIDHAQDVYDLIALCKQDPAWQHTRSWAFLQQAVKSGTWQPGSCEKTVE